VQVSTASVLTARPRRRTDLSSRTLTRRPRRSRAALGTGPVSLVYLDSQLGQHGFTIDRLRADRILHEALTAGPDPLHLALVFNLSHATATRYTTLAQQLLDDEPERSTERKSSCWKLPVTLNTRLVAAVER
jgi:hypothetical protein